MKSKGGVKKLFHLGVSGFDMRQEHKTRLVSWCAAFTVLDEVLRVVARLWRRAGPDGQGGASVEVR